MTTTFFATSRSGAVRERRSEGLYTHAVDNGREIISFHGSFAAADRKARRWSGERVVDVHVKPAAPRRERVVRESNTATPKLAARHFEGKLHFGETVTEIRVVESFDPNFGIWEKRDRPEIVTVELMREFHRAGLTKVALKDNNGHIADFSVNELR